MKVERILAGAIMACLFATASSYGQWPETKTPQIPLSCTKIRSISLWCEHRLSRHDSFELILVVKISE